jgi:hypothetical protein
MDLFLGGQLDHAEEACCCMGGVNSLDLLLILCVHPSPDIFLTGSCMFVWYLHVQLRFVQTIFLFINK